jgi:hypothetical protein
MGRRARSARNDVVGGRIGERWEWSRRMPAPGRAGTGSARRYVKRRRYRSEDRPLHEERVSGHGMPCPYTEDGVVGCRAPGRMGTGSSGRYVKRRRHRFKNRPLHEERTSGLRRLSGMDCAQLGTQIAGRALHGVGGVLFFVAVPPSMRQAAGL